MQQPLYICFVDFKKAFDSVSHDKLWVTMMDMVSLLGSDAFKSAYIMFQLINKRSVAEWLACWTQTQKGLGSNRSRDAVG